MNSKLQIKNKTSPEKQALATVHPGSSRSLLPRPLFVQPKLAISKPGDEYEREADRIAQKVINMPERHEDEDTGKNRWPYVAKEVPPIKRKMFAGHDLDLPGKPEARIQAAVSSSGQHLSPSVRRFFEPRLGYDFSSVRVHTDTRAAEAARAVNARAFTVGRDLIFGQGQYAPFSNKGKLLLAHELVHIVQQSAELPQAGDLSTIILGRVSTGLQMDVDLETIREKLTCGLLDWQISEKEVHEVLSMLRPLTDEQLQDVLTQLESEKLVDRIFAKISEEDRSTERDLLARIRRLRPSKTLFLEYLIRIEKICRKPAKGWQVIDSFRNLSELVEKTRNASETALISKLGILAHGDQGGVLRIGSTIVNVANIDTFASDIGALSGFLTPDATVYIYGCVTGSGKAGSAFLKEWSLMLPGRTVVGFNVLTKPAKGSQVRTCFLPEIATTGKKSEFGYVDERTAGLLADEENPAAKIARNGRIVKWPIDESEATHDGTKESTRKYFQK